MALEMSGYTVPVVERLDSLLALASAELGGV